MSKLAYKLSLNIVRMSWKLSHLEQLTDDNSSKDMKIEELEQKIDELSRKCEQLEAEKKDDNKIIEEEVLNDSRCTSSETD